MADNEIDIANYLVDNIESITLKHIGLVEEIGAPKSSGGYTPVNSINQLNLISTEEAGKKADIYINGQGVSLKQSGASFLFNRLQRAELISVFSILGFADPEAKLARIDKEIDDFHNGLIQSRSRPWQTFFEESDFKLLLKFLMTEGSPNRGVSTHPADLIIEAPKHGINIDNIHVYTFDEYFEIFKKNLYFALRRQWIGQNSNSEHGRTTGLAKKEGNKKCGYDTISGEPSVSNPSEITYKLVS